MAEPKKHLRTLFTRYYRKEATPAEVDELMGLLNERPEEELQALLKEQYHTYSSDRSLFPVDRADQLWTRIQSDMIRDPGTGMPGRRLFPRVFRMRYAATAVAAMVLLMLGLTFYFQWIPTPSPQTETADGTEWWAAADQIAPGGNRATLSLADGRSIELQDTQTGIVLGADGIRYGDGSPVLTDMPGHEDAGQMRTLLFRQLAITTPAGGTYQVTLADGSRVWLNAGSTLSYPTFFAPDQDRMVELEGEAYFEVAHTGSSFRVKTRHQVVEVLGTRFNVNAYNDEPETTTTLIEGKVMVVPAETKNPGRGDSRVDAAVTLSPNEQAVLRGSAVHVRQTDVSPYIAWTEGTFSFEGKTFRQVLSEIGRWYDLKITYESGVPDESFFGEAYRSEKLSGILKLLESNRFGYRLKGRELIITENKT